jgi:hypothetical protein
MLKDAQVSYTDFRHHGGCQAAVAINETKTIVDFFDTGDPSGIKSAEMGKKMAGNAVYNLQGQRIAAPRKGMNIIDGKKVILK